MENNNGKRKINNMKINFPKLAATLLIGVTLVTTGCSQFKKLNDNTDSAQQSITIATEKLSFNDQVNKLYQKKLAEAKEKNFKSGYNYDVRSLYNVAFEEVTSSIKQKEAKEKVIYEQQVRASEQQVRASEKTPSGVLLTDYYDNLVENNPKDPSVKLAHDEHEIYVKTGNMSRPMTKEELAEEKRAELEEYYKNDPQGQIEKSIMDKNAKEEYYKNDPQGQKEKKQIEDTKQKEYYKQYKAYLETLKIPESNEQKSKTK